AAHDRGDLRVDHGDEGDIGAVERIGETALVPLGRESHVSDDPVPVGFELNPFDPSLFLPHFRGTVHFATIGTSLGCHERYTSRRHNTLGSDFLTEIRLDHVQIAAPT